MTGAAGRVMTVLGPVEPETLGRTLVHEHLVADLRHCSFVEPPPELAWIGATSVRDVDPAVLSRLSCSVADNLVLDDPAVSLEELRAFADAGGGAIVDVTPPDLGRDPALLRRLSEQSGIAIVMGCGHYCEIGYRDDVESRSDAELFEEIVGDLTVGVDGIRAGIVGEIGVNGEARGSRALVGEMTETERRVLHAAARAAREVGAPMTIHMPSRASAVPAVLAELEAAAAPLERVSLSHMDAIPDLRVHEEALAADVWIHYDCFGMALRNDWYEDPGDDARIDWLLAHKEAGRLDRVLLSHDVWCKAQLRAYGGGGYAYLLAEIAPRLLARGFSADDLDLLFRANPARFLAWA